MSSTDATADSALSPRAHGVSIPATRALLARCWPVALAGALAYVVFHGQGGQDVARAAGAQTVVLGLGGVLVCLAAVCGGTTRRSWGAGLLVLMVVYGLLAVASIAWSLTPGDSWVEANRTFAYVAAVAGGVALARLVPRRADGLLVMVGLACVAAAVYGLAAKSFPTAFHVELASPRLRDPFGYWNAAGAFAGMGVVPLLWLGSLRTTRPEFRAAAYPPAGVLVLTVALSSSRGAVIATALGACFWFAVAPRRLHSAALLLVATVGAAAVALWASAQDGLSRTIAGDAARVQAGHRLALLTVVMVALLALAGWLIEHRIAARPPTQRLRTRAARLLVVIVALLGLGGIGALIASPRGLGGTVSNAWHSFTTSNGRSPTDGPSRLVSSSTVQGRYWHEATRIWSAHPLVGTGIGSFATVRLRYRSDILMGRHAHGFGFQTLADLGTIGLTAILALLLAWLATMRRALGLGGREERARPWTPERIALAALAGVVITFGVHSSFDWTWVVPGIATTALLCAGFIAGRGPYGEPSPAARSRGRASGVGAGVALITLLAVAACVWSTWQPERAQSRVRTALDQSFDGNIGGARDTLAAAKRIDSLALEPLLTLATVEHYAGNDARARLASIAAVRLEPSNPITWRTLGENDLQLGRLPDGVAAMRRALALDPRNGNLRDRARMFELALAANRRAGTSAGPTATPERPNSP